MISVGQTFLNSGVAQFREQLVSIANNVEQIEKEKL